MVTELILEGISNAKEDILPWQKTNPNRSRSGNVRAEEFIEKFVKTVNEEILGTVTNPAQWFLNFEKDADGANLKLKPISMTNGTVRAILNELEKLINISTGHEDNNKKWKRCIPYYREALKILRKKKENYTQDEIENFQKNIDLWFSDYVALNGKAGCTNYTHVLAAGHVRDYMKRWGNLSKFSNQGWESLNAMIKTYFFRSTNRGGGGGAGERTKTKLTAIGDWFQRRLMWLCYNTDLLFQKK